MNNNNNLREFVQLPSSWPPACVDVGVKATVHCVVLAGSGRSAAELGEAHLEPPLLQFWHIWPENGYQF